MVLHCLRSWFWFIPDVGTVFYGGPGPRWSGFICSRFWFYDLASINHGSCSSSILHYSLVSSCFMPLIILLQVLILSLYYYSLNPWAPGYIFHCPCSSSVLLHILVLSCIYHASCPSFILIQILVLSCIINALFLFYSICWFHLTCIRMFGFYFAPGPYYY